MRDYQMTTPSLEGVLSHDSMYYGGLKRPIEILRFLDSPANRGLADDRIGKKRLLNVQDEKVLEQYFYDLYGVFMKKLSHFLVESSFSSSDGVQIMAMLQEIIKIKKWISRFTARG